MIAVLQRVSEASVAIKGREVSSIDFGLLVLLGIEEADDQQDIDWLARKVVNMRIFDDENGVMNRSVDDIEGELLVVSQFTLHASTKKGNRPSYIRAARPEKAIPIYEAFIQATGDLLGKTIRTGEFGAAMKVSLVNDGPVTILIDTKNKQ